jgi:hypothetical protein
MRGFSVFSVHLEEFFDGRFAGSRKSALIRPRRAVRESMIP